jgi:NAD(P)H-flavin reductase
VSLSGGGAGGLRAGPDPFLPELAVIRRVEAETPGTATFHLVLQDPARHAAYRPQPGQFNMLYVPGVGEVPISVSSDSQAPAIAHTIRAVGMVTQVIDRLRPGDMLGFRGPYGAAWPLDDARGRDLLIVAGGLGLAPLRSVVRDVLRRRDQFGRLTLLYGARTPADLLYAREFDGWERQGLELGITVDRAEGAWTGTVGVVPALLSRLEISRERTVLFVCGPEVMMRFTILEALSRGVAPERVWLSIELNMQCAVGLCGRCQLGPYFVCRDGPVFQYGRIARFLNLEHF